MSRQGSRASVGLTGFVFALAIAVLGFVAMPSLGNSDARGATNVLLGTWTTYFVRSSSNAFGKNIIRPAQLINGQVIQPGATFNFARDAGPFTVANGYGSGGAIVNGQIQPDGVVGGGLCSAATTVFNAAVRAGLQIDKRYNHSFYIGRYPVGLDATIWVKGTRGKNVIWTNDTGNPLVIRTTYTRRSVTFQVWGIKDGRTTVFSAPVVTNPKPAGIKTVYSDDVRPGRTKHWMEPSDGFYSVVERTVKSADGTMIHHNYYTSAYKPMMGLYLFGRRPGDPVAGTVKSITYPSPTPTPTPTRTPSATPTSNPTSTPTSVPTTNPPTNPPTQPPTEPPTAPPTDPPTAPPTDPPTAPPTDPPTAPPTDPPTPEPDPPTDPPTEEPAP